MQKMSEVAERQFNELAALAKEDPRRFEIRRQALIKEFLDAQTDPERKRRLTGLQWKIDQERMRFKGDPLHFASYVFGLMWNRFTDLNALLQGLRSYTGCAKLFAQKIHNRSHLHVVKQKKDEK